MSSLIITAQNSGAVASSEQPPALSIRLFGPIAVRVGEAPLPRLRSRKGLWLLALLALRAGRSVERLWLAGTLWPDSSETHALRSLRQSLHDLRRALGAESHRLICENPRTLRLDIAEIYADALVFDNAIARGDSESLKAAVGLYRGPLVEDCAEEWIADDRRHREQACLTALETLASESARNGEHMAAIGYLDRAIAIDPYREDLLRALMRSQRDIGNIAEALLTYRKYRDLLWREMSASPAEETSVLFRELRDKAREHAAPRVAKTPARTGALNRSRNSPLKSSLPQPLTPLIGRKNAVREVIARLRNSRLVTLTGTGGIGKTRLALRVAEELAGEYEDGARFVNLAPLADPETVPAAVRSVLGVPHGAARQHPADALRQFLSARRLLLVLDNCEHLLSACAALADALLSSCPGLVILATSRHSLGLRGETIWRVPPLTLPPAQGEMDTLTTATKALSPIEYTAVRLFVERASAAEDSFALTESNAPAIAQVCQTLDGIPLAIEMAAARVRSLSVEEISAHLHQGLRLLASGDCSLPTHQQTLAATFNWSWILLTDDERTLLRRLSVFAGGWTLRAAEAVCAGSGIHAADVLDLLTALVDQSLVRYRAADQASDEGGRYNLLITIRHCASERLRQSDDAASVRDRHRDYFLELAETIKAKLRDPDQIRWFNLLEAEHDNLRAALEWCRTQNDAEKEVRLAAALCRFWDTYGHLREGRAHIEAAISGMPSSLPHALRTLALVHAGWMAYVQSDLSAARRFYSQAVTILRENCGQESLAQPLNFLAMVAVEEGNFDEARALFEESLAICREIGPAARLGSVLQNLGNLLCRQGNYEAARDYLNQSCAWCEAVGDRQLHGLALCDLAAVDCAQRRDDDAQTHCAASLRLLNESGALIDIPPVIEQMALIAQALAHSEYAARLLGAAESVWKLIGAPPPPHIAARHAAAINAARCALGSDVFGNALAQGKAMDRAQAVAFALQQPPLSSPADVDDLPSSA